MMLDRTLSTPIRTQLLCFLIHAYQSLDCAIIRKECAPLVSIGVWHNLSSDGVRDAQLNQNTHLRKAWRAAIKRYDAADDSTKARLRFERSWLYTLLLDFLNLLFTASGKPGSWMVYAGELPKPANTCADETLYCERFTEFISDLQSQLPTRRYVNTLLHDLHLVPAMGLSPMYCDEDGGLLREQHGLLKHYTYFTIDDQTGAQLSRAEAYDKHCARLGKLQRVSLKHFKDKLSVLALSNYGSIDKKEELQPLLDSLTDEEILRLMSLLDLRTTYPESVELPLDRRFFMEVLLSTFEKRETFQESSEKMALAPTEQTLFDNSFHLADAYDGSHPLALPKLNLQYLSVGDFLWRALILYRREAFYGIRKDIESAMRRLKPESRRPGETQFTGFSKMAMPISRPAFVILASTPLLLSLTSLAGYWKLCHHWSVRITHQRCGQRSQSTYANLARASAGNGTHSDPTTLCSSSPSSLPHPSRFPMVMRVYLNTKGSV